MQPLAGEGVKQSLRSPLCCKIITPAARKGGSTSASGADGSVAGHDALNADAELCVVDHRGLQEGDSTGLALICLDLGISDARGVVDADVDVLPTHAPAVALSPAITGDAMSYAVEPAEFFLMSMWISSPGCSRS